jgi:hypothetical protein
LLYGPVDISLCCDCCCCCCCCCCCLLMPGCPPGTGITYTQPANCTRCSPGTYSTGGSLAFCTPCSHNAAANLDSKPGSTSIADCTCRAGKVQIAEAASVTSLRSLYNRPHLLPSGDESPLCHLVASCSEKTAGCCQRGGGDIGLGVPV